MMRLGQVILMKCALQYSLENWVEKKIIILVIKVFDFVSRQVRNSITHLTPWSHTHQEKEFGSTLIPKKDSFCISIVVSNALNFENIQWSCFRGSAEITQKYLPSARNIHTAIPYREVQGNTGKTL